jgi:hypothetical protein
MVLVTALGSWEKLVPRGRLIMPYTSVRPSLGSDGEDDHCPYPTPVLHIVTQCSFTDARAGVREARRLEDERSVAERAVLRLPRESG